MNKYLSDDELILIAWFRTLGAWEALWLMYWLRTGEPKTLLFLRCRFFSGDPHQVPQITAPVGCK